MSLNTRSLPCSSLEFLSDSTSDTYTEDLGFYQSIEQFETTKIKNDIFFYKKIFNEFYRNLYIHSIFKEIDKISCPFSYSSVDIDMEKFLITNISEGFLASTGASTCFIICFKGKTFNGDSYIGLCHTSNIIEDVISSLKHEIINKNHCLENTIEFFVLGGRIICDDPQGDSLEEMEKTLKLAQLPQYNIKGVVFNTSLEMLNGFNVLFTGNKIYYSTKCFFNLPPNKYEGKYIFEIDNV